MCAVRVCRRHTAAIMELIGQTAMFKSFRITLVFIILVSAGLPVTLFSSLLVGKIRHIIRESAVRELGLTAKNISDTLNHEMGLIISHLQSLGKNRDIALAVRKLSFGFQYHMRELGPLHLRKFLSEHPLVNSVYLTDMKFRNMLAIISPGGTTCSDAVVADMLAKAWIKHPGEIKSDHIITEFRNKDFVSASAPPPDENMAPGKRLSMKSEHGIAILVPVPAHGDNDMRGTLLAIIPPENFASYAALRVKEPVRADFLRDGTSMLYQQKRKKENREMLNAVTALFDVADSENPGKTAYGLSVSEPARICLAELGRVLSSILFYMICAMIPLLAMIYLGARCLTLPLDEFVQIANAYAEGRYDLPRGNLMFSEFRKVADVLRGMGDKIAAQIDGLRKAEENYRSIFENAVEGIFQTSQSGVVINANPAMLRIFGYDPEKESIVNIPEFVQRSYVSLADRKKFASVLSKKGQIAGFETELLCKDGDRIWVSISARVVRDENGKVLHNEGAIENITERKKAEEEVRRLNRELERRVRERTAQLKTVNHQLEEAIRYAHEMARDAELASISKSEFLANMSHEIRTPMSGVIGACELAMNTDPDCRQREYLDIIRASARSLLGIINDILDFSKIEAGRLELENLPFSIREVTEEVCDLFFDKIAEKRLEIILDISSELPSRVIGDSLRLRQVLTNLLSNAFKFTGSGEICILTKFWEAGERDHQDFASDTVTFLFCIRDTGIGIKPEVRDKLFEAFTQGDGTVARKYGGTGLGLAICRRIVNMMDGDIWAESELGKGSAFFFTARFGTSPGESALRPEFPRRLKNLRVLAAEGNASALRVIRRMLESFGFRVETARDAGEALAMYRESVRGEGFDLILTDADLPGTDGITVAEEIMRNFSYLHKYKHVRTPRIIIMMSVYGRGGNIRRAGEAGFEHYLIKPARQSVLCDRILEAFGCKEKQADEMGTDMARASEFSYISVLLAEDNMTNQRIATEVLKMAGISVDVVGNGSDAVRAVMEKTYDAVFMDVQMPEMDGMEATRIIRKWENGIIMRKRKSGHEDSHVPIPIIAMTAHAMSGHRELFLGAGMTDYVPKPINQKELFAALRRSIPKLQKASVSAKAFPSIREPSSVKLPHTLPDLELEEGLKRLEGSRKLYIDILGEFLNEHESFAHEFRSFVEKEDFETARMKAHALKGGAGNVSAPRLQDAAGLLEKACESRIGSRGEDSEEVAMLLFSAEEALARLAAFFEKTFGDELSCADYGGLPDAGDMRHAAPERLSELLVELGRSLRESDPVKSESCIRDIGHLFTFEDIRWQFEELARQTRKYDFEAAERTLDKLVQSPKLSVSASAKASART